MPKKLIPRRKPYRRYRKNYRKGKMGTIRRLIKGSDSNAKFHFTYSTVNHKNNNCFLAVELYNLGACVWKSNAAETALVNVNDTYYGQGSPRDFSSYQQLYDMVKVRGVSIIWTSALNVNTTAVQISTMYDWVDFDNTPESPAFPVTTGNFLDNGLLKIRPYGPFKRYIKCPRITFGNTSTTLTQLANVATNFTGAGFYNAQAMPRNGLYYLYLPNNLIADTTTLIGTLTVRYYVTFRHRI